MSFLTSIATSARNLATRAQIAYETLSYLASERHPKSFVDVKESQQEPCWGWTMPLLQAKLQDFCSGDIGSGQEIYHAMMRDPLISHGVETRAEMLVQIPKRWEKPEQCPSWYFDLWVENYHRRVMTASHMIQQGQRRLLLGVTPDNVTWSPDQTGTMWLPTLHTKEPGNLSWDTECQHYTFAGRDGTCPVYDDAERWLLWKRAEMRPHLSGLLIPLSIVWLTKQEAVRGWPSHNRSHTKPQRALKVPANQAESEDTKKLVQQAQSLLNGGVLVLPQYAKELPSFDFSLIEARADTYRTFSELIKLCDQYITLVLLGVTENTQGGSASDAKAKTQDRLMMRKIKADARQTAEIEHELSQRAAQYNRIDPRFAPIPIYDADPPDDQNEAADRNAKKAQAGKDIGALIEKLDAHNEKQGAVKIEYEPDYLAEQVGLLLTRKQDGHQSRAR